MFISTILAPDGPIHEWHIKRSGKRDEIHLSREKQTDGVSGGVAGSLPLIKTDYVSC
jgi:hypothetical protein